MTKKTRRNTMLKKNHPKEVIGYFLQTTRPLVRDELGKMWNVYDKFIKGKAIEKKIHTFDGTSSGAFFIDFSEYKPKTKKLTAYKKMQEILNKAAQQKIITKSLAKEFKVGKITAPIIKGKIDNKFLEYEDIKVKKQKISRKKPFTLAQLVKEMYEYLSEKGYLHQPFKKQRVKVGFKVKRVEGKRKREAVYRTSYMSLLSGNEYWINVSKSGKGYWINFMTENSLIKEVNENFISPSMHFDEADKAVLGMMLKRIGIKASSVSKGTKTKGATIGFKGKKFSITGTLTGFTRNAFVKMAEKLGGKFQNHVSKDLDMLIVGSKPGKTKVAQAKKYGVKIIKFNQFFVNSK